MDPFPEDKKMLVNLKIHDLYMFIWEFIIEIVMFVYILRKNKGKIPQN